MSDKPQVSVSIYLKGGTQFSVYVNGTTERVSKDIQRRLDDCPDSAFLEFPGEYATPGFWLIPRQEIAGIVIVEVTHER